MQKIESNIFFQTALREVPRLLGQIDRNPLSKTYGSCDRAFWHYRTNDISSMRYQEAALTLALLSETPFAGNPYYDSAPIRSLANAVIRFACSAQRTDGSFDEWYPHEGSFVCTAFVTAALARAALVLGNELEEREVVHAALMKSGAWLARHTETLVVNQLSGAVCALHDLSVLTDSARFREEAARKCTALLSLQHGEGWWNEYGGPDAGYLSLTIDYLSRYAEGTGDVRAWNAIEKASAFLLNCINPDGTVGGEYLSRNTEYLIPSGFVRAASHGASTATMASLVFGLHQKGTGILPYALDDRYVCYLLYNWIEAGLLWGQTAQQISHHDASLMYSGHAFFPGAGLFVGRNETYQIFVNLRKGGSLRLYARGAVLIDSGIGVRFAGSVYAGNIFHPSTHIAYDESRGTLRSTGILIRVRVPLLTTGRAIALKTFQLVFGRIPVCQTVLKRVLRAASVLRPGSSSGMRYERTISIGTNTITICDVVHAPLSQKALTVGEANIYALVPSSRYAAAGTPLERLRPQSESFELVGGSVRLTRVFAL